MGGSYLSSPVTKKISHDTSNELLVVGVCSMQGWRETQEDSHNCELDFDTNTALFAVYDGHGGSEVAEYCSAYLPQCIKDANHYRNGNVVDALTHAFLRVDKSLISPDVLRAMKREMEEGELDSLRVEAAMPLDQVLDKYRGIKDVIGNVNVHRDTSFASQFGDLSIQKRKQQDMMNTTFLHADEEETDDEYDSGAGSSSSSEESENDEEKENESERDEAKLIGFRSGCTAVVAVIRDGELFVANAGDSRCVVCQCGTAIDMSREHKPEDDVERKRIENAGGKVSAEGRVNNGLNVSRAIGDHSYKRDEKLDASEQLIIAVPDVRSLKIDSCREEFMVIACDGVWNCMSSQSVVDFVRKRIADRGKVSTICEELLDACLSPSKSGNGTGCDNMTCIVVKFKRSVVKAGKRSREEVQVENEDRKRVRIAGICD
uniref:protein-serine/threonine phosphatase n=1 Tax=Strigamia maritima TaxID=126957 RepID=T1J692_STRMM